MLGANVVVTAWVRKNLALITACIGVAILLVGGLYVFGQLQKPKVLISGTTFVTELQINEADRARGLSGRDELGDKQAMTFVFDSVGERCIWMKDMQFSIDIVWLNEQKKIVAVEQNVTPETYPQNFCHPGQYVIEFKSGTLQKYSISSGDTAIF
jgi:uncharacterized membrane protein (UPF0127 family)